MSKLVLILSAATALAVSTFTLGASAQAGPSRLELDRDSGPEAFPALVPFTPLALRSSPAQPPAEPTPTLERHASRSAPRPAWAAQLRAYDRR